MKYKLLALLFMAVTVNSCKAQSVANETMVLMKTTAGDITIKLYNETPFHRDNFIKLVQDHYYDSLLFHRVIRDFMVQTGDPDSKNAPKLQQLGTGGPDYTIPAEFVFPKYYHKRGALCAARKADQVNPEQSSSGSQFYIVTGKTYGIRELREMAEEMNSQMEKTVFNRLCAQYRDSIISLQNADDQYGLSKLQNMLYEQTKAKIKEQSPFKFTSEQEETYMKIGGAPHLDGQYTVFGEVIDGMKVVDRIGRVSTDVYDRPLKDVRIITMEIIK